MTTHFPDRIRSLSRFEGPFEARRLAVEDCEILFATYPAGTNIEPHHHATENVGVITSGELILLTEDGEQRVGVGEWYHYLRDRVLVSAPIVSERSLVR